MEPLRAVNNHWTGLVDWTTGLKFNHKYLTVNTLGTRLASSFAARKDTGVDYRTEINTIIIALCSTLTFTTFQMQILTPNKNTIVRVTFTTQKMQILTPKLVVMSDEV